MQKAGEKTPKEGSDKPLSAAQKALALILGALTGAVNGFFGAGGGMLCVPVLQKVLKKPPKSAHATAILVILPISSASAITYFVNGFFEVKSGIIVSSGVLVGGIIGAFLLTKLKNTVINLIFSLVMIAAGIRMLF